MKLLKHEKTNKIKICGYCECIFSYNKLDIIKHIRPPKEHIICPECHNIMLINDR